MWEKAVDFAITSGTGLWAVLFIILLAWVLKTNNSREARYIGVIEKQAGGLSKLDAIAGDVADIKRWTEPGGAHRGGGDL